MTQGGKKFIEYLSVHPEITEKLNMKAQEDGVDKMALMLECARKEGFDLTAEDFAQETAELSEDELSAVAGGGACACIAAGGGTPAPGVIKPCACAWGGFGFNSDDKARCACPLIGGGTK